MKEKPRQKSRPVDINLNTPGQSLELRIALLLCPLILTLPVLLLIILSKVSVILAVTDILMMILALWAPWRVLHLANNRLRFEPEFLRLGLGPAIVFEKVQAADLICDSGKRPLSLCLTLSDSRPLKINLGGISKEDAAKLWSLISNKLRNAAITPTVRETLLSWHSSLVESLPSSSEEKLQDNQDLRLLINLKARRRTSAANESEFRFWVAWIGSATTMTMLIYLLVALATNRLNLPDFIWGEPGYQFFKSLVVLVVLLFGNIFGALAFVGTLVYLLYQSFRRWTAADSVFIDSLGFTAQMRTPAGTLPQEHLSWNSIESIELVDPHKAGQKQKRISKDAYILVTPSVERPPLHIPVKCIASEKLKSNFLEALDAWGRRAKIDSRVREALAPQMDGSFTELWLSSLESAPNLAALTPLKSGLELINQERGLTIEKPLGSGGQGMTYLAADKMGKKIVLKETILPVYVESARKKAAAQFELQAALLKSLDHPGIVKLHDYFVTGNRAYLALEYLEGQTLEAQVTNNGPLPQSQVLELALQMADILIYLHSRTPPVVHRDFTPDNLIVDKDGRIKLIDFGTALLSDEGENSIGAAGKQNYLPPEQYRGKPCRQSDIYALAATIYFLLTGRLPEPLTTSNPTLVLPQIDQELSKIVEKATALDLQTRYGNAEEVLADLKKIGPKPNLPRLVVSDQTALPLIVEDSDDGAIA